MSIPWATFWLFKFKAAHYRRFALLAPGRLKAENVSQATAPDSESAFGKGDVLERGRPDLSLLGFVAVYTGRAPADWF
jgi:hypothetical protein